jgi:hypothetical protein
MTGTGIEWITKSLYGKGRETKNNKQEEKQERKISNHDE